MDSPLTLLTESCGEMFVSHENRNDRQTESMIDALTARLVRDVLAVLRLARAAARGAPLTRPSRSSWSIRRANSR